MSKISDSEIESAKAAGEIQFAINLLNQRLVQVIRSKLPGNERTDFSQSLRIISKNLQLFLHKSEEQSSFKKESDRAIEIRNQYSHQD